MVRLRHGCRGYLVNWDVEKSVWWRAFKSMLQQQPQECGLLMTEPPFNLPSIQTSTMQVNLDAYQLIADGQFPQEGEQARSGCCNVKNRVWL